MSHFWKFIHNALIHPLMAWPWEPQWVTRLHDWTQARWTEAWNEHQGKKGGGGDDRLL